MPELKARGGAVRALITAEDEWISQAAIPDGPAEDGVKLMDANDVNDGFPGGNALVLRAILGREPRSLQSFFEEQANG